MPFDTQGALSAGYSVAEINDYLAQENNFDLQGAMDVGYSDEEVFSHLTGEAVPAPEVEEVAPPEMWEKSAHAVLSGVEGMAKGLANAPAYLGDLLNYGLSKQAEGVTGVIEGLFGIEQPDIPSTSEMVSPPTVDSTPIAEVANQFRGSDTAAKKLDDLNDGEFMEWLGYNVLEQAPQIGMSVTGARVKKLRGAVLPAMGAMATGGSYSERKGEIDEGRALVSSGVDGVIEILSEKLPFKAFDKVTDAISRMPVGDRLSFLQKTLKAIGATTAAAGTQAVVGGAEEVVAQAGQNLSAKHIAGEDVQFTDNLKEAAILGAAASAPLTLPHAVQAGKQAFSHAPTVQLDNLDIDAGQAQAADAIEDLEATSVSGEMSDIEALLRGMGDTAPKAESIEAEESAEITPPVVKLEDILGEKAKENDALIKDLQIKDQAQAMAAMAAQARENLLKQHKQDITIPVSERVEPPKALELKAPEVAPPKAESVEPPVAEDVLAPSVIGKMKKPELVAELKRLGLPADGKIDKLRDRLHNHQVQQVRLQPSEGTVEPPKAVEYVDPRLGQKEYGDVEQFISDSWKDGGGEMGSLVPRPGAVPTSDTGDLTYDYNAEDLMRLQSENPQWVQSLGAVTSKKTVLDLMERARRGEQEFTENQKNILDIVLTEFDQGQDLRTSEPLTQEEVEADAPPSEFIPDQAEYSNYWDEFNRSTAGLYQQALQLDAENASRLMNDPEINPVDLQEQLQGIISFLGEDQTNGGQEVPDQEVGEAVDPGRVEDKEVTDGVGQEVQREAEESEGSAEGITDKVKRTLNGVRQVITRNYVNKGGPIAKQVSTIDDFIHTETQVGSDRLTLDEAIEKAGEIDPLATDEWLDVYDQVERRLADKSANEGESDGLSDTAFSRKPPTPNPTGTTVSQVKEWLAKPLSKLGDWVDIEIVQTVEELRSKTSVDAPSDVRGMYNAGKVWIVADNIKQEDAPVTLAHEVVGHMGLEELLGKEGFMGLVKQVQQLKRLKNQTVLGALETVKKNYTDERGNYTLDETQESREILAHLAENKPNYGLIRKIKAKIKLWLARNFDRWADSFDDAMLESLLVRAAQRTQTNYSGFVDQGGQMVPAYMTAWHGSPHDHEGFTTEKIDKGEVTESDSGKGRGDDAGPLFSRKADPIIPFGSKARHVKDLDAQAQYDAIVEQYKDTEEWMEAPNGAPTNLNEQQWVQVRTPAFKSWFGDWENDPENASKVIDDNGEPRVVYHGTDTVFDKFSDDELGSASGHPTSRLGHFFAEIPDESYTENKDGGFFVPVFLSIKESHEISSSDMVGLLESDRVDIENEINKAEESFDEEGGGYRFDFDYVKIYIYDNRENLIEKDDLPDELQDVIDELERSAEKWESYDYRDSFGDSDSISRMKEYRKELVGDGYEGIIVEPDFLQGDDWYELQYRNYVAFSSSQIKSAISNIGPFDPADSRILFQKENVSKISGESVTTEGKMEVGEVESIVEDVKSRRLAEGTPVKVVAIEDDLPTEIRRQAEEDGATGTVEGAFHEGVTYIVADKMSGALHVEETLLHEAAGHKGGQLLFGKGVVKAYNKLFLMLGSKGVKAAAKKRGINIDDYIKTGKERLEKGETTHERFHAFVVDELVAQMYGKKAYESLPARFRNAVKALYGQLRDWLRRHGYKKSAEITDSDLQFLLKRIGKAAADGGKAKNGGAPVFMTAWHGSPHDHNKFSTEQIGTGEGDYNYVIFDDADVSIDAKFSRKKKGTSRSTTAFVGKQENGELDRLQTSHPSLEEQSRLKTVMKRWLSKEGNLGTQAHGRKLESDSIKNVGEHDNSFLLAELERGIRKGYGKFPKKLTPTEREAMNDFLAGKENATIPESVREPLRAMRTHLDNLSTRTQQMIKENIAYQLHGVNPEKRSDILDALSALISAQEAGVTEDIDTAMATLVSLHKGIAGKAMTFLTIEQNKGQYLNRSYQAFDDPKWGDKVRKDEAVMAAAKEHLEEKYAEKYPELEANELAHKVEGAIGELLEKGHKSVLTFMSQSQLGQKDLGVLKRRKEIAPEIRALWGEYKDPRYNYTSSADKMTYLLANHHLLKGVREDGLGNWLSEQSSGRMHSKITAMDDETMAPLAGLYATPEMAQAIKDATDPAVSEAWLKSYLKFNSAVKVGKTVLAPTTTARNFLSASMFTVMNGHFNPIHGLKAATTTWADLASPAMGGKKQEYREYLRKLISLGVLHDNPHAGELADIMKDMVGAKPGVKGFGRRAFDLFQGIYRAGDDFWKIVGFENERKSFINSGMSEKEAEKKAAERIRDGYPTYSMVPKGIKALRRWPFTGTFVSFPWEILRTSKNQLAFIKEDFQSGRKKAAARRAVGVSVAMSLAQIVSQLTMDMMGFDDEDDEAVRKIAAPWQDNAQLAYLGYDEDGLAQYLDLSHLDPYAYIKKPITALLNGNYGDSVEKLLRAGWEGVSPFLGIEITAGAAVGLLANKDLTTGRPVWNEADAPDEKLKDMGLYAWKNLAPGVASNITKMWKASDEDYTDSGKKYDMEDEVKAWFGLRFTTMSPKVAMKYRAKEFSNGKRDVAYILSGPMSSQSKKSKADIKRAYDSMNDSWGTLWGDMQQVTKAGKKLGMSKQELVDVLTSSGVSMKDTRMVLQGKIPPWKPSPRFLQSAAKSAMATSANGARKQEVLKMYQERKKWLSEMVKD